MGFDGNAYLKILLIQMESVLLFWYYVGLYGGQSVKTAGLLCQNQATAFVSASVLISHP